MNEENRNERLREALRRGDPAAGEAGLSPLEAQAMRRTVLAAVPAPRRSFRLVPAFTAAAVVVLSFVVTLGLWRAHDHRTVAPVPAAPAETPPAVTPPAPAPPEPSRTVAVVPAPPPSRSVPAAHPAPVRLPRTANPPSPVSPPHPSAEEAEEPAMRQVQFSTPGGTRIIWLLPETSRGDH
jgi:hypothetical protein